MSCRYCSDSGSVTMVHDANTTSFACSCACKGAECSRGMNMQPWNGMETQVYRGEVWFVMWAKTMGLKGEGVQDHWPQAVKATAPVRERPKAPPLAPMPGLQPVTVVTDVELIAISLDRLPPAGADPCATDEQVPF